MACHKFKFLQATKLSQELGFLQKNYLEILPGWCR